MITDLIIAIIFCYATGLAITAIYIIRHTHSKRFFLLAVFMGCICIIAFFTYAVAIEPFNIIRKEESIDLDEYSDTPIKLIVISDLHIGRFLNGKKSKSIVEIINAEKDADYVLILGDIINETTKKLDELDELADIDPNKNIIFIYGNHDYFRARNITDNGEHKADLVTGLEEKLESLNFTILKNESIVIDERDGKKIVFAGIEDLWAGREDYSFLENLSGDDLVIFLGHNPDCIMEITENEEYKSKVDLVLSGHTHGGEMRMPVIGSISPFGLPTELSNTYDKGWFNYEGIPLFITSGTGNVGVRMRTFNQPEVVILTIK